MYTAVLFIHSWLRYVVLIAGLWLLVECIRGVRSGGSWADKQEKLHKGFLAALDVQFLLGLALYFFLSPLTAAARANMAVAMKEPHLRFFGVEHIATMLIAVGVAHVGRVRAKRRQGRDRFRSTLITTMVWFILTIIAIPWPGLDVARPLFRF
jgi:hypothetical protein